MQLDNTEQLMNQKLQNKMEIIHQKQQKMQPIKITNRKHNKRETITPE
jgi:hypothetical protein